jgi:GNAT superfamily N-acetyltransferase
VSPAFSGRPGPGSHDSADPGGAVVVRDAREADLPAIVALYADDDLGSTREQPGEPLAAEYRRAFADVEADPRTRLVVAEVDGAVVGTLQLSFLPHVVRRGGERAQIEAVRVSSSHRGSGLGRQLLTWAVERARERGCVLLQLTTDAARPDAHRFYESLGFTASHVGMKLLL